VLPLPVDVADTLVPADPAVTTVVLAIFCVPSNPTPVVLLRK
jgi:hypothetical protein